MRTLWSTLRQAGGHPARRVSAMAALGVITGLGESAVVLLVVALASRRSPQHVPFARVLPASGWGLASAAVGAVAVLATLHLLSARVAARVGAESLRSLRGSLLDAYLHASWVTQSREPAGELQETVTGTVAGVAFGVEQAASGIAAGLTMVVVMAAAVVVTPWSAAGLAVIGLITVVVVRPSRRIARRVTDRASAGAADVAVGVAETASVARELRAFDVTEHAQRALEQQVRASADGFAAARFAAHAIPNLTRDLTVAVIVVGLAIVSSSGSASLAEIGTSVVLLLRALAQAQTVSSVAHQVAGVGANLDRIGVYLDRWRDSVPRSGSKHCPPHPTVALDGVSYRYPGDAGGRSWAVQDVNLTIEPGEQVGLVGRTGAGKSTVAGLLLGVLEPERGRVLAGGVDLRELRAGEWQRRVAWVPQDPALVRGTVLDNIVFYRTGIDRAAAIRAAEGAGLGDELVDWPDGVDRRVGPGGVALSGGERQRVALARALAGRPDLIVLDEPTSAVDSRTEEAVRATLAALSGRTSVVIIAHRAALLRACDHTVELRGGLVASLVS